MKSNDTMFLFNFDDKSPCNNSLKFGNLWQDTENLSQDKLCFFFVSSINAGIFFFSKTMKWNSQSHFGFCFMPRVKWRCLLDTQNATLSSRQLILKQFMFGIRNVLDFLIGSMPNCAHACSALIQITKMHTSANQKMDGSQPIKIQCVFWPGHACSKKGGCVQN